MLSVVLKTETLLGGMVFGEGEKLGEDGRFVKIVGRQPRGSWKNGYLRPGRLLNEVTQSLCATREVTGYPVTHAPGSLT